MLGQHELRVGGEQGFCLLLRGLQHLRVRAEIRHVHLRQAMLAGAEEIARAAQTQILLGDLKAVVGFTHDRKAGFYLLAFVVGDKDAPALVPAAPDTAAQLMQLAETEALGVFDDHQRGVRHVHADLDDRRRDKDICFSADKGGHDRVLVPGLHAAMDTADGQLRELPCEFFGVLLGRFQFFLPGRLLVLVVFHLRADDKDLPPLLGQLADKAVETRAIALVHGKGVHLLPSGRQLVDDRDVQIAVDHQRQCARDRRGRHDEHMRFFSFSNQRRALAYAEAVLLVRDDQAESRIFHVLAEQGVRPHHQIVFSRRDRGLGRTLFLCAHRPGQLADAHPEGRKQAGERGKMLLGEDLRRRHKGTDKAVFPRQPAESRRDKGLAAADVSLD